MNQGHKCDACGGSGYPQDIAYRFFHWTKTPHVAMYISDLPGHGGKDWGYSPKREQALILSAYWLRRLQRDVERAGEGHCCVLPVACPVCLGAGSISDVMPAADAVADAETLTPWLFKPDDPIYRCSVAAIEGIEYADEFWAGENAERAAHAAFRAVPGLRGQE